MRLMLSVGLFSTLIAAPVQAQATDCPAVGNRVSAGTGSVDDLVLIMKCPAERAGALASFVTVRKAETDTMLLLEAYWGINRIRSAQTFEALMSVAPDAGASVQSRVLSVWALLFVEHGSTSLGYGDLATLPLDGVCQAGGILNWDALVNDDAPLPTDHRLRVLSLTSDLTLNIETPPAVRSAARCLATTLAGDLTVLPQPPGGVVMLPPLPATKLPSNITLGYLCEDRYYIRDANPGIDTVTMKYKNTGFEFDLIIPGPTAGLPYSQMSFHSLKPDKTILLFYHGNQIGSAHAPHNPTPCSE